MFSTAIVLIVLGCALRSSAQFPSPNEAQAKCCPHWYSGNLAAFHKCTSKYGFWPICPQDPLAFGCRYRGQWYAVGSIIEANAKKCYEVHCVRKAPSLWPSVRIKHISKECNCCEFKGRIYEHDHIIHLNECERIQCNNGTWEKLPQAPGDTWACPAGSTPWDDFCIYFWPVIMSWPDAQKICHLLGGSLIVPLKPDDNEMIADGLRGAGGWLGASNGKWPDTSGRAWKVSPWAPGQPTNGTVHE
ncbi:uncharacterized protein LOC119113504 [Pollicipes pollicipes]|uniref:uncharacterized protein LOC119113504 n=1 Tax=Pollicipes pollicipes TaxID=41117 RepID=UPI001884E7D3|nr:uncharacterized protein LOC119113504 [Pollicipes pollicipes]